MKKISLMILLLVVALASCKKTPEVNLKYVDVERDLVTVGTTTANIQCDYEYIAALKKAYFCYGESETNMNSVEMRVVQNTLYVKLAGLRENTTYSYYYEFFNGFNSMRTVLKTFKTETGNGGGNEPPTPPTPPSGVPEGAIDGLFTINENGDQVYFSKGNLQYQASTNTWRFAEHQWDFVGGDVAGNVYENGEKCNNELISPYYSGWIDLFGWGTSGYNHGAVCYQPWSTSSDNSNYYAFGSPSNNLVEKADWGYNAISNGGNQNGLWRTLTKQEWEYILNNRNTSSGIRFVKAQVNDLYGIIILPDAWANSYYTVNNPNNGSASFTSNIISSLSWNDMETHGALFLPKTGMRIEGGSYGYWECNGDYWSSTVIDDNNASRVMFDYSYVGTGIWPQCRFNGRCVRLVKDAIKKQ